MATLIPEDRYQPPEIHLANARLSSVARQISSLKAIAAELFRGDILVEIESDPEIADCDYFLFNVSATGDLKEISALRREWFRRTQDLLQDDCDKVRLAISGAVSLPAKTPCVM